MTSNSQISSSAAWKSSLRPRVRSRRTHFILPLPTASAHKSSSPAPKSPKFCCLVSLKPSPNESPIDSDFCRQSASHRKDGYRSAQAPRAVHAPQGAQERQRVPEALGEAVPLPGPPHRCALQQGCPAPPLHEPHQPPSHLAVPHRGQPQERQREQDHRGRRHRYRRQPSPDRAQDVGGRPPRHRHGPGPHHRCRRPGHHARPAGPREAHGRQHPAAPRPQELARGRQALWLRSPQEQEALCPLQGPQVRACPRPQEVARLQGLSQSRPILFGVWGVAQGSGLSHGKGGFGGMWFSGLLAMVCCLLSTTAYGDAKKSFSLFYGYEELTGWRFVDSHRHK